MDNLLSVSANLKGFALALVEFFESVVDFFQNLGKNN